MTVCLIDCSKLMRCTIALMFNTEYDRIRPINIYLPSKNTYRLGGPPVRLHRAYMFVCSRHVHESLNFAPDTKSQKEVE